MARFDTAFTRSPVISTKCEEFAQLDRLKLKRAVDKTRREVKEVAYGAVVSDTRSETTKFRVSKNRASVGKETLSMVLDDLSEIDLEGYKCLFHTHPTEDARPSPADAKFFLSSLVEDEDARPIDLAAEFNCFYIISQKNSKGHIRGWEKKSAVEPEEFEDIKTKIVEMIPDESMTKDEAKKMSLDMIELAGDNIESCKSTFGIKSKYR